MLSELVATMTFAEALDQVLAGQRVTKLEWADRAWWGTLVDGILCLHKPDGEYSPWKVSDGDMRGTDWVIWEP